MMIENWQSWKASDDLGRSHVVPFAGNLQFRFLGSIVPHFD